MKFLFYTETIHPTLDDFVVQVNSTIKLRGEIVSPMRSLVSFYSLYQAYQYFSSWGMIRRQSTAFTDSFPLALRFLSALRGALGWHPDPPAKCPAAIAAADAAVVGATTTGERSLGATVTVRLLLLLLIIRPEVSALWFPPNPIIKSDLRHRLSCFSGSMSLCSGGPRIGSRRRRSPT